MQTLSGSLIGLADDVLAVVSDDGQLQKIMHIKGRYYYVKKCIKPELLDGIIQPRKSRMDHPFGLILAAGDQCGKPARRTKRQKQQGMTRGQGVRLKPMTMVLMPDDAEGWFIKESPYSQGETVERFVHEDIIKGVIEK